MCPLANLLGFYVESYPLVTAIPHRREPTTYPRAPGLSFGRKPQGHWATIPTFLPTKWIETSKSSLSLRRAEDRELTASRSGLFLSWGTTWTVRKYYLIL